MPDRAAITPFQVILARMDDLSFQFLFSALLRLEGLIFVPPPIIVIIGILFTPWLHLHFSPPLIRIIPQLSFTYPAAMAAFVFILGGCAVS